MATNYCKNCGANLAPESKFCENCGKPVDAAPTKDLDNPAPSKIGIGVDRGNFLRFILFVWLAILAVFLVLVLLLGI